VNVQNVPLKIHPGRIQTNPWILLVCRNPDFKIRPARLLMLASPLKIQDWILAPRYLDSGEASSGGARLRLRN
jgi:hypothetical protein